MSTEIERRRLDKLAKEIGQEVRLAEEAWRQTLRHAITAGEKLTEAKSLLNHGEWRPWLTEHFPGSERTAQLYMQLARNAATVAHFPTVRDAVALLAKPKEVEAEPPADADDETADEVRARIDRELGPPPKREHYSGPNPRLDEAHYLLDDIEYQRDRVIATHRYVLAGCAEMLAHPEPEDTPRLTEAITAMMLLAATGIAYEEAERACAVEDGRDHEVKQRALFRAHQAHEDAREAWTALKAEMEAA
jgi:hypothetical protein